MTGANSLFQKLSSKFANPDPYAGMTQRQIDALKNEAEKEAQKKIEEKRYSLILSVLLFELKTAFKKIKGVCSALGSA